jgi:hypothetical protein
LLLCVRVLRACHNMIPSSRTTTSFDTTPAL